MTRGHAAFSGLFPTSTWPVLVLAFLAGLFSATALPPWSFPLGIFGFSVLFVLIYQTKTIKKLALIVLVLALDITYWVFNGFQTLYLLIAKNSPGSCHFL